MRYKNIEDYVNKVCEQVRFKKAHYKISKEIENHIIEQKESFLKYGITEDEAMQKAINEMGDAVLVGESFNSIYKPKLNWNIVIFVCIMSITFTIIQGIFNLYPNYLPDYNSISLPRELLYTNIGIIVMIVVYYIDFYSILKYANIIYLINIVFMALSINNFNSSNIWIDTRFITNNIMIYLPLFFISVIYVNKGKGYKGIIKCLIYIFLPVFINNVERYILLFYIISTLLILIYSIHKNYFNIKNRYIFIILAIIFFTIMSFIIDYYIFNFFYFNRVQIAFYNNDKYGLGYVNYAFYEILKNSRFIGEMLPITNSDIDIKIIDTFLNDMIILKFIMKFGYISLIAILAIFILFFSYIYNICNKQKSVLGNLVCMSIFFMFIIQFIMNISYNIFYIWPSIGIPFISGGLNYKIYIMFNIGIFLSVYKEKDVLIDDINKIKLKLS